MWQFRNFATVMSVKNVRNLFWNFPQDKIIRRKKWSHNNSNENARAFWNIYAKILMFTASWLKTCSFKDPDFIKCSTGSVQGLFDNLLRGIKGVEGLDSIDPMRIDRIRILQGEGPVSVNASLSKVKVMGFSKVKVVENQVSNKDYSWITTIKLPKMRLEGNYHMMGRILVIPLNVSCIIKTIKELSQLVFFQGRGRCWFEPSKVEKTLHVLRYLNKYAE